jgi:molecular chaperone DnaK (HSP70)
LSEGKPFEFTILRKNWEVICEPILGKTVGLVKKVLHDSHIDAKDINQIILAGGGTRIPMVSDLVKTIFPGHEPIKSIDSDQVVVMGAALLAQDIAGNSK